MVKEEFADDHIALRSGNTENARLMIERVTIDMAWRQVLTVNRRLACSPLGVLRRGSRDGRVVAEPG